MRRPLLLATALLTTLTALTLTGAAVTLYPSTIPAAADVQHGAANRVLVTAFYDAANIAIATGDLAPLDAVIAPDFVDRSGGDAASDRDGLARRLLALHAAAPAMRLRVEALAADGDTVIAAVQVSGNADPTFLGLHRDDTWTAWGPVDVFRIAEERIAERWGSAGDPSPPLPDLQVALDMPPPEVRTLTVTRVALAPGVVLAVPVRSGPRLVVAESGTVAVEVIPTASYARPSESLRAGEHLLLSSRASVTVANIGQTPAAFIDLVLAPAPVTDVAPSHLVSPAASLPEAPTSSNSGTTEVLAADLLVTVPARSVVLSLGRVTLAPGERLDWTTASGPVLLHVERGTVDLTATGSIPWVRAMTQVRPNGGVEAALVTGGGALLDTGAAAEIRAAPGGPATVLLLTLLPANGPRPAAGATPTSLPLTRAS